MLEIIQNNEKNDIYNTIYIRHQQDREKITLSPCICGTYNCLLIYKFMLMNQKCIVYL